MAEVIVVGAGFAGLATAAELARVGVDVVVLEARSRVGGRVWSQRLQAPDGTSVVIERGAEFVLSGYETLEALAAEYGLSLADTGMSYYVREPRGAGEVDATALGNAGVTVASAARASGARSVVEVVAATGIERPLAEAVLARIEISCALEATRLAPSVLEHVAAFEPLPSHRIAGGNQRLAEAMAERVGRDRVRLNTPVAALDRRGERIRMIAQDGVFEADQVALAVPVTVLRGLAIDPPLPNWKLDALARIEVGQAAKLHLPLAAPAPTSAVMSVPDRFWCWTATEAGGRVAPVLNCFAGSPSALKRLAVEAGAATWIARILELRRDLAPVTSAAVLTTWHDDPWALGAYRSSGLADVDEPKVKAPVGGVHFAGEYTAGDMSGLMEGALRSGVRAAAEICHARSLRSSNALS
jgi:monoamine oxidase